jgi:ribonuclease HIII
MNTLIASSVTSIAGIDEAGRGALAGPVVAAACILPDLKRFPVDIAECLAFNIHSTEG